jgi:CRISPR-associated endonuclease Cas1
VLERAGSITFDVLAWLAEQDIPLFQVDYRGRVVTAFSGTGHAANPRLMQAQLAAAANPKRKLALASWFIQEKLTRSAQVLRDCVPDSSVRASSIEQLKIDIELLGKKPVKTISHLLGVEGRGAKAYFEAWHDLPIKWQGIGRHPIPPEWHRVGPRSSAKKPNNNKRATHPVHAMLNYAYAVLEGQIKMELVRAGFDATIGFLHTAQKVRPALALDVLEPARATAERAVLNFLMKHAFSPSDFVTTPEGVVRLHPQLARRIVAAVDVGYGHPGGGEHVQGGAGLPPIPEMIAMLVQWFMHAM